MAIAGKNGRIKVMSDAAAIPFAEEATTANVARTEYSITNRTKRYWSREAPVVVETSPDGVSWGVVSGGFWISYAGGKIVFRDAQPVDTQVRVSGEFVAVAIAVETREYSMSINNALVDVTVLEGDGWRRKLATIVDATGTLSGFYNVDNLLVDKILEGKAIVIEMDVDITDNQGETLAVYGLINSHEMQSAIESAVTTSVGWESDGDILVEQK